jgi:hypothetical protein
VEGGVGEEGRLAGFAPLCMVATFFVKVSFIKLPYVSVDVFATNYITYYGKF